MRQLIVVGFSHRYRAVDVLNELRQMNFDWVVDLEDAVAVYRDNKGKLRIQQSYDLTSGDGAALGGIWGALVGAALAAIPFTAGVSAAAAGPALAVGALTGGAVGAAGGAIDASWWKEDAGIPDDFVKQVGGLVQPGNSAIFALLDTNDPDAVAAQFRGYGGTVLRTNLSAEQSARIEKVLQGAS
jgi:uncharacterized membrane protein